MDVIRSFMQVVDARVLLLVTCAEGFRCLPFVLSIALAHRIRLLEKERSNTRANDKDIPQHLLDG